jgi:hypothetical protein
MERKKEVIELRARPKIIRRFLPNLSDKEPRGIASIAAITMKEKAMSPTSTVDAPSDTAYRGIIGIRMKMPIYTNKVKTLARVNGVNIPSFFIGMFFFIFVSAT